jgi:ribosomal peptide maturation radical SAM protein 1
MDVVFPVMPFADVGRPALGVGLLSAAARRVGMSSRVLYLNIDFAGMCGLPTYQQIAGLLPPDALLGEWFFADMLFGTAIPEADRYIANILSGYGFGVHRARDILGARAQRVDFVERCLEQIAGLHPRIVALSTTFHQTCACIAIAQGLKKRPDPPIIIFGGANCEGEMGIQLLRSFPSIDYVSVREADLSFPAFLSALTTGERPRCIPGIVGRDEALDPGPPRLVIDLNDLPIPAFDEYFETLRCSSLAGTIVPELPMETSRGCWWGEKHHCTFCGLNGETMAFRRKSEDRILNEMRVLSEEHGCRRVSCVDNILDVRLIRSLFPRLEQNHLGLDLFFEVKANLRRHQLAALKAGGVRAIQPGIESFSTQVLKLMRKGCSGVQNIQCLRWAEEVGIDVLWNILAGFPGEDAREYDRLAELVPLLVHLPAPASCTLFRMDRFSPMADDPAAFGLHGVRPARAYFYVFPFGRRVLSALAYYFEFDYADGRKPGEYIEAASREVSRWAAARDGRAPPPRLDAWWERDGFEIIDTRPVAPQPRLRLVGLPAALYLACDSGQSIANLHAGLARHFSWNDIEDALSMLVAARLMVQLDGQYLSLAVIRQRPATSSDQEERPHEAALA